MTEPEKLLLFKVAKFAKGGQTQSERKRAWEEIEELMKDVDNPNSEKIRVTVCPECGWETAAKTNRGRILMIKKHSEATGHKKFVAAFVRRPPDVPF